jgi:PAS domain S-box-containing protein
MSRCIQESEERYRMQFSEHANDSILIVDPETLRFLDVNENAAARLGYTRNVLGPKTSTLPSLSAASRRSSKRCRRKAALSSEAIRG